MSEPTTTAAASTAPTEAELEAAYTQALQTATKRTRRNSPLRETAIDAAADSVIWARDNWNPARDTGGGFLAFAGRSAATWVHRAIVTATRKHASTPEHVEAEEWIPARHAFDNGADVQLPLEVQELPDDLRDAVRLFYIDRFGLRECALLLGIGRETVRARLKEAAMLLANDHGKHRPATSGQRRLLRGKHTGPAFREERSGHTAGEPECTSELVPQVTE